MMTFSATAAGALPSLAPVSTRNGSNGRTNTAGFQPVSVRSQFGPPTFWKKNLKLAMAGPIGLGKQLQHSNGRYSCYRKRSASVTCSATTNARCSASGQTQTLTREAPTIIKAPVREPTDTPKLDDGGPGLPPRDDGGGGGGGGGGGNFSGGFFLFGFLAFLGFLKDQESEQDYRGSRRR